MLGECHYNGYGVYENEKKALKWYGRAAEQGNQDAINKLKELEM